MSLSCADSEPSPPRVSVAVLLQQKLALERAIEDSRKDDAATKLALERAIEDARKDEAQSSSDLGPAETEQDINLQIEDLSLPYSNGHDLLESRLAELENEDREDVSPDEIEQLHDKMLATQQENMERRFRLYTERLIYTLECERETTRLLELQARELDALLQAKRAATIGEESHMESREGVGSCMESCMPTSVARTGKPDGPVHSSEFVHSDLNLGGGWSRSGALSSWGHARPRETESEKAMHEKYDLLSSYSRAFAP